MKIDVLTLFPEMFGGPFSESLMKKAQEKGLLELNLVNIRNYTEDKHKTADDSPYGGGSGMVMKLDPIAKALKDIATTETKRPRTIYLSPTGRQLTQKLAKELSNEKHLVLLCGHYEGIDERIRENLITDEISIGDYVLTGGELPAMVLIDTVARLIPGVVKEEESLLNESFESGILDYPSYTRPEDFEGKKVPEALSSGNHAEIAKWRRKKALENTFFKRPDLLPKINLSKDDKNMLEEVFYGG